MAKKSHPLIISLLFIIVFLSGQASYSKPAETPVVAQGQSENAQAKSDKSKDEDGNFERKLVTATLVANRKSIQAGKTFLAGV